MAWSPSSMNTPMNRSVMSREKGNTKRVVKRRKPGHEIIVSLPTCFLIGLKVRRYTGRRVQMRKGRNTRVVRMRIDDGKDTRLEVGRAKSR